MTSFYFIDLNRKLAQMSNCFYKLEINRVQNISTFRAFYTMITTTPKPKTGKQLCASDIPPTYCSLHPLPNTEMPPLLKQHQQHLSHLVACMLSQGPPGQSCSKNTNQGKEGCPLQLAGGVPAEALKQSSSPIHADRFSSVSVTVKKLWSSSFSSDCFLT